MTKLEKRNLIRRLTRYVEDTLVDSLDNMPKSWDGTELRWLLTDTLQKCEMPSRGGIESRIQRYKKYCRSEFRKRILL